MYQRRASKNAMAWAPIAALLFAACGGAETSEPDARLDPADECATCAGKADSSLPEEGSCEAKGLLEVANTASFEVLDDEVPLNRLAAKNIVKVRTADGDFLTLKALDDVRWVGKAAFKALNSYAIANGYMDSCQSGALELGIISDLDDTVIPPATPELSVPPYAGMAALYQALELRENGKLGDLTYVTARKPDRVVDVPDWLTQHGVPLGPIETGVSGVPWIAENEKVDDITGVLDAHPGQKFVMFGDNTHRDPEAYAKIVTGNPDRIEVALIHEVDPLGDPARYEGLVLYDHAVEAAAVLEARGLLTEQETDEIRDQAKAEGLDVTQTQYDLWLDEHAP